jgi:hypothetical protein
MWLRHTASILVLLLLARPVQPQSDSSSSGATGLVHSAAAGAAYVTTCLGQYTANPLTPQCVGSYADLQQLVVLLLQQPLLATPGDLAVLQNLCTATVRVRFSAERAGSTLGSHHRRV